MSDVKALLAAYLEDIARENYHSEVKASDYESGRRLLDLHPQEQITLIHLIPVRKPFGSSVTA